MMKFYSIKEDVWKGRYEEDGIFEELEYPFCSHTERHVGFCENKDTAYKIADKVIEDLAGYQSCTVEKKGQLGEKKIEYFMKSNYSNDELIYRIVFTFNTCRMMEL